MFQNFARPNLHYIYFLLLLFTNTRRINIATYGANGQFYITVILFCSIYRQLLGWVSWEVAGDNNALIILHYNTLDGELICYQLVCMWKSKHIQTHKDELRISQLQLSSDSF